MMDWIRGMMPEAPAAYNIRGVVKDINGTGIWPRGTSNWFYE